MIPLIYASSRSFWNCLKPMDDSVQERSNPPISEESWMSHFESLHSNEPLNSHQEATHSALHRLENATHFRRYFTLAKF